MWKMVLTEYAGPWVVLSWDSKNDRLSYSMRTKNIHTTETTYVHVHMYAPATEATIYTHTYIRPSTLQLACIQKTHVTEIRMY